MAEFGSEVAALVAEVTDDTSLPRAERKQHQVAHASRKSARAKTYRYRIYRQSICPPFLARYVWHYPYPLDEDAMRQAAGFVIGEYDFTSFAAVDSERGREDGTISNVRRIFVDNSTNPVTFWAGNNHGAEIIKLEPLE